MKSQPTNKVGLSVINVTTYPLEMITYKDILSRVIRKDKVKLGDSLRK